jgi:hypothetical protein
MLGEYRGLRSQFLRFQIRRRFLAHDLPELLARAVSRAVGGTVFACHVVDPERYGVVAFDETGNRLIAVHSFTASQTIFGDARDQHSPENAVF